MWASRSGVMRFFRVYSGLLLPRSPWNMGKRFPPGMSRFPVIAVRATVARQEDIVSAFCSMAQECIRHAGLLVA